jgi:hypothetical protein
MLTVTRWLGEMDEELRGVLIGLIIVVVMFAVGMVGYYLP